MTKWCKKCQAETERRPSGQCVICARAAVARYHAKNKERRNAENKEWRKKNAAKVSAQKKARYDREINNARTNAYRRKNPEKVKAIQRAHYKRNPGLYISHALKREARMQQQHPSWADKEKIEAIYRQAAEFRDAGIDVEVDHFYPLKGRTVSGLHCEFNLRIITRRENRSKGARIQQETHDQPPDSRTGTDPPPSRIQLQPA